MIKLKTNHISDTKTTGVAVENHTRELGIPKLMVGKEAEQWPSHFHFPVSSSKEQGTRENRQRKRTRSRKSSKPPKETLLQKLQATMVGGFSSVGAEE